MSDDPNYGRLRYTKTDLKWTCIKAGLIGFVIGYLLARLP